MKTKLLLVFFTLSVMIPEGFCQFSFGVSPGIGLNGVHFGYRTRNKFVPYIGFQYMTGKFKSEETGQEFDNDLSQVVSYSDKMEFSGGLYLPAIGLKYFIKEHNKLHPYLSFGLTKPIISGKVKVGKDEENLYKEIIESLNKSMWGGELGFGVEYFFDENFSIGGEFGLRFLHLGYSNSQEDEFYNPNTGLYETTVIKNEIKLNGSPTFSKVSLNYYF